MIVVTRIYDYDIIYIQNIWKYYICCVCCAGDRYFYVYTYTFSLTLGRKPDAGRIPAAVTFYLARRAIFGIYDVLFIVPSNFAQQMCVCFVFGRVCIYSRRFSQTKKARWISPREFRVKPRGSRHTHTHTHDSHDESSRRHTQLAIIYRRMCGAAARCIIFCGAARMCGWWVRADNRGPFESRYNVYVYMVRRRAGGGGGVFPRVRCGTFSMSMPLSAMPTAAAYLTHIYTHLFDRQNTHTLTHNNIYIYILAGWFSLSGILELYIM